jgi:class 3 adenylate cyclase
MSLGAYPSIFPNLRAALSAIHVDMGQDVRGEFTDAAAHDFADLLRNVAWIATLAFLAEACASVGDVRRARLLYDLLLPFAERNVTIGPLFALGSASYYLALLAATLHRPDDAARHFEAALAMNGRMGMRHELARTQVAYADILLARNAPGDRARALPLVNQALETARELGMKPLVEKALARKLKAQGIVSGDFKVSIDAVVSLVERERPDLRAHAAPDGTVTILFSDIEGSTAMTERLGDARAQEVIRAHNRLVREQVAAHGGFEVKSQGDGFMLTFQSARRALRCAIALQRAFAAYATEHPEAPIRVRIGLHTGETIREADDFFGKAVIQAARIADQAAGGEILVSSLFRELTQSAGEFTFGDGRAVELKGLAGSHQVYQAAW